MPAVIKSTSLSNYQEVARSVGLDPLPLLREVGIRPSDLAEPDARVPLASAVRLLEHSALKAGVEDFGLRMAETRRLSNLGLLALLAYVEATVREALFALIRYLPVHTDAIEIHVEESGGIAVIREEHRHVAHLSNRQEIELSIGVLYRVLRAFLGEDWQPQRICFAHAPPADRSPHRRFFRVRIDFNSEFDGIVCRSKDLDRVIPTGDPVTASYLHRQLDAMVGPFDEPLAMQVRHIVASLLPTGHCSAANVARQLGLAPRSFFRKMVEQNASYADILNVTREELAARYMRNHKRTLSEISDLLGFSSLSAFSRWFTRRHGRSPSSRRRNSLN